MPDIESARQVFEKRLKAEQLHDQFKEFREALIGGKDLGFGDFYDKVAWMHDEEKITGWVRVLDLCRNHSGVVKGKGRSIKVKMLPWKNKRIWEPFVRDLLAGLNQKFTEQKDILSVLAYLTGPDFRRIGKKSSLIDFFRDGED